MNWEPIIRLPVIPGIIVSIMLARLATQGLSWSGVGFLLFSLLWLALTLIDCLVNWRERRKIQLDALSRSLDQIQAPLSLVFLLEESREVNRDEIAQCVKNGLELDLGENDHDWLVESKPTGNPVPSNSPDLSEEKHDQVRQFMVRLPEGVFAILVSSQPYLSEVRAFAKANIRDKRLRTAIENHRAWLSVDLISATPEEAEGRRRAYGTISRILAAMAGPDCRAIYAPEIRRCNEFDPSFLEALRSGYPLAIFDEPTFEPVIEIAEDNPRMVEAVEEALRRWHEFVEAFHQREDPTDDRFIVKAEFVEGGRSEFMWMAVTGLDDVGITGLLMNDPHELISVHRGKKITVGFDRLNDWLFPDKQGDVVGGFTLKVLSDESEERRRRDKRDWEGDD